MDELTPEMATQLLHHTIPAVGRLGIVIDRIGAGEVELRVPIEGNANHYGTMYAGALFAVSELPGGLIPLAVLGPSGYTPIVADMQVRFVAPARTDVTLMARIPPEDVVALAALADQDGRAEFVLDLEARDALGRTVIATRGTYQLRPRRG